MVLTIKFPSPFPRDNFESLEIFDVSPIIRVKMNVSVSDVLQTGLQLLGRARMNEASFKNQFGVYPPTVLFIVHSVPACPSLLVLLKTLYFMKEYPTEEQLKNMRVSPSYFRKAAWACVRTLHDELPEVSEKKRFFFLWFFEQSGLLFFSNAL